MLGHGEMKHDAGDAWVVIQFFDGAGDALEGRIARQRDQLVVNTDSAAGFALALRVKLAGRRRADENRGQVHSAAAAQDFSHASFDFLARAGGDRVSVDDLCRHRC